MIALLYVCGVIILICLTLMFVVATALYIHWIIRLWKEQGNE